MESKEINIKDNHSESLATDKVTFGFWIYIMTDLIMFAVLFACYAVLHNNTFGGPSGKVLFNLPSAFVETLILLTSSFTAGIAMFYADRKNKNAVIVCLLITFVLGLSFLTMEFSEFSNLINTGNSFTGSAFLSSFFALVGTHGIHIASGLLWLGVLFVYIFFKGLTDSAIRKLTLFSLFWHFLDIVWILIFTIVYLMSAL